MIIRLGFLKRFECNSLLDSDWFWQNEESALLLHEHSIIRIIQIQNLLNSERQKGFAIIGVRVYTTNPLPSTLSRITTTHMLDPEYIRCTCDVRCRSPLCLPG
jgi:hypothetical protein